MIWWRQIFCSFRWLAGCCFGNAAAIKFIKAGKLKALGVTNDVRLDQIPDIKTAFSTLSNYERPKKIYSFSKFPFTETGKIKRSELLDNLDHANQIRVGRVH